MARKRYTSEQIIRLLRQADVLSSQGKSVPEISREMEYPRTPITGGVRNT